MWDKRTSVQVKGDKVIVGRHQDVHPYRKNAMEMQLDEGAKSNRYFQNGAKVVADVPLNVYEMMCRDLGVDLVYAMRHGKELMPKFRRLLDTKYKDFKTTNAGLSRPKRCEAKPKIQTKPSIIL
jgi:hypothetical protein